MENNYRAYFFQNMYLHGIHAGVQSQHTTAEMFIKYLPYDVDEETSILYDWANFHKTTIVLNGGMSGALQEIVEVFDSEENNYPWATFSETEYALNGALTNVGIILPEKVYAYDKFVQSKMDNDGWGVVPDLTEFELKIVEILRGKRLMN